MIVYLTKTTPSFFFKLEISRLQFGTFLLFYSYIFVNRPHNIYVIKNKTHRNVLFFENGAKLLEQNVH
jgi:hypothetical protein